MTTQTKNEQPDNKRCENCLMCWDIVKDPFGKMKVFCVKHWDYHECDDSCVDWEKKPEGHNWHG